MMFNLPINARREREQMDVLQAEIFKNMKIAKYYRQKIRNLLKSEGTGDIKARLASAMTFYEKA